MNNENLLNILSAILIILAITIVIYLIWWMIWNMIRIPIRMKDDILEERETARQELYQIQAQKGVEWDRYKEQQDELNNLRKTFFKLKEDTEKIKEEKAKLQLDKENLAQYNKELKKNAKAS